MFGATPEAHDKSLKAVITRLLENGLTLNKEKCQLNQKRLEFFGHVFTADGVSVDPKRIATIQTMQAPRNVADVRSLLSMLNYNSRFIANYASLTEPLRRLTRAEHQKRVASNVTLKVRITISLSFTVSETVQTFYHQKLQFCLIMHQNHLRTERGTEY